MSESRKLLDKNLILKSMANFDPLLTVEEAAEYLSMHKETLLRHAREGRISHFKDSGEKARVKFRLSQVNAYINRHTQKAAYFPLDGTEVTSG